MTILTVKLISRFYRSIGHRLKEGVLFGEVCPEFLAKKRPFPLLQTHLEEIPLAGRSRGRRAT